MPATGTTGVTKDTVGLTGNEPVREPVSVGRRVWLDLVVPAGVDVEALLAACAGRARLVVQCDPVELPGVGDVFYADQVELPVDGFYVETYCRRCGCTDSAGCDDGCWWVEEDLCSACADDMGLVVDPRRVEVVPVQGGLL